MTTNNPHEYARRAQEASDRGDHALAEELWLRASQLIALSHTPLDARNRRAWDQAAKRARRLIDIAGRGSL